jgi:uncharacterized protein
VDPDDHLIVVDFSYPANWLEQWESSGALVTVIDHHEPKFGMLSGFSGAILDAQECGATLAWRNFFPDRPMPELLKHIRSRDMGRDGYYADPCPIPESHAINEAFGKIRHDKSRMFGRDLVGKCRELWSVVTELSIDILRSQGEELIEERDRIIDKALPRALESDLCGHKCMRIQLFPGEDRFYSMIGNRVCRLYRDHDFVWIVLSDGSNSLRSIGDFDVSAIARMMGGDGHKNAAGWIDRERL